MSVLRRSRHCDLGRGSFSSGPVVTYNLGGIFLKRREGPSILQRGIDPNESRRMPRINLPRKMSAYPAASFWSDSACLPAILPALAMAGTAKKTSVYTLSEGGNPMSTITTKDGAQIFYKDWGSGQPIVFHHGWPLSADDWDAQMLFFVENGYRVIAHDRRGHGRSSQIGTATTWTTTPPTSPLSSSISTCATPSTSAIPPAAARSPAMSPATARAASPRRCSSAPCRRSW